MPSHLLAVVVTAGSLLSTSLAVAAPPSRDALDRSGAATGAIRTDRLSPRQLKTWNQIVEIVMAEDEQGQPLHPTLRGLWDAVDSSGHSVEVELVRPKDSYVAGRFEVTAVDPEGRSHQARVILNLRAIDKVSTHRDAARPDGFIPFAGLDKQERYAELLGHELAHAAWHLADVERARLAGSRQSDKEELMRQILAAGSQEERAELMQEASASDRLGRELERVAESAEQQVWSELTGRR